MSRIDDIISESEPLEAFEIDDYVDFEELLAQTTNAD